MAQDVLLFRLVERPRRSKIPRTDRRGAKTCRGLEDLLAADPTVQETDADPRGLEQFLEAALAVGVEAGDGGPDGVEGRDPFPVLLAVAAARPPDGRRRGPVELPQEREGGHEFRVVGHAEQGAVLDLHRRAQLFGQGSPPCQGGSLKLSEPRKGGSGNGPIQKSSTRIMPSRRS